MLLIINYFEGINFRGINFAKFAKVCPAKNVRGHIRESFSREILYKLEFAKVYPAIFFVDIFISESFSMSFLSKSNGLVFYTTTNALIWTRRWRCIPMIALQNIIYNRCSIPSFRHNPQFIPSIAQ